MTHQVVVPYAPGYLNPATALWAYQDDHPVTFYSLPADDPYAYADLLRRLWREPGDLVVVEHDVIPPVGSITALLDCMRPWCTHPHWVATRYVDDSLGLARFHRGLKHAMPDLADRALARADHRVYTRLGLTNVPANASPATLDRDGVRACLRPDASFPLDSDGRPRPPSTVDWTWCDTALSRLLRHLGITPHVHQPPTTHLHDYQRDVV